MNSFTGEHFIFAKTLNVYKTINSEVYTFTKFKVNLVMIQVIRASTGPSSNQTFRLYTKYLRLKPMYILEKYLLWQLKNQNE